MEQVEKHIIVSTIPRGLKFVVHFLKQAPGEQRNELVSLNNISKVG